MHYIMLAASGVGGVGGVELWIRRDLRVCEVYVVISSPSLLLVRMVVSGVALVPVSKPSALSNVPSPRSVSLTARVFNQ